MSHTPRDMETRSHVRHQNLTTGEPICARLQGLFQSRLANTRTSAGGSSEVACISSSHMIDRQPGFGSNAMTHVSLWISEPSKPTPTALPLAMLVCNRRCSSVQVNGKIRVWGGGNGGRAGYMGPRAKRLGTGAEAARLSTLRRFVYLMNLLCAIMPTRSIHRVS